MNPALAIVRSPSQKREGRREGGRRGKKKGRKNLMFDLLPQ